MNETGAGETIDIIIIEIVDVEDYVKRGEKPPHAHNYRFRVDDHYYVTKKPELTGTEILTFAGKTPEKYSLRQRFRHGKVEPVEPEQEVNLREHGIERFITIPKENTDGGRSL
jgi:Multiubiquitin